MVIGGDVDFGSSRTNTVELLTPNATLASKCRKNVEPLFGSLFDYEKEQYDYESLDYVTVNGEIDEFEAADMTGLFVKDAPIGNHIDLVHIRA